MQTQADTAATAAPHVPCFSLQIHASSVSHATGAAPIHPPALLVKVGNGEYRVLQPPPDKDISYFMNMDAGTLLKTVRGDELFSKHMEGVALDQCKVYALSSMADTEPSVEEQAQRKELKGAQTMGAVLGTPAGNVFLHIALATPAGAAGE